MKKVLILAGVFLLIAAAVATAVILSPEWSRLSFEATVEENLTGPNGEARLIVRRTTEVHGAPVNSLLITGETEVSGKSGETISIGNIKSGDAVTVTLKNSFIEETPFLYPTVYTVTLIS